MTFRRQILTYLAFPLVACSGPTVSDRGVEVTLTVDRTVFRPGDTAQVNVVAANRGARPVTINSGGCPAAFVVLQQGGAVIRPGAQMCAAVLSTRELGPGESYVFRHTWALDGASGTATAPQLLRGGTYELRGLVGGQYLRAESSPVEIRIESVLRAGE